MTRSEDSPQVREQYEALPYPPRDPREEKNRLIKTWLDDLPMINHYCFAGRQTFRNGFRVLVAGGGTGDATIFLAEQLRHTDAGIVHLDLSRASIEVGRERAKVRALENISWVNDSLLALPALGLGEFDYINCSGVLHHLADPDAGLSALLTALNGTGALGIMVYAQYGRTGVYQMQSLMRLINQGEADAQRKIANTRDVLNALPSTNWFKRGEADLYHDHKNLGDAGLFDLLLHSQDRAYTIDELYAWFCDRHGLHLELTDVGRGRAAYLPELAVGPQQPQFLQATRKLPPRQQYAIAELLGGNLVTHSFFATHAPDTRAPYGDPDYVPFFFHEPVTGPDLSALIRHHGSAPFVINHAHTGVSTEVNPGKFGAYILDCVDGQKTFGEIFSLVRQKGILPGGGPDDAELFRDFRPFFEFLAAIDRLLLRHKSVPSLGVAT
jgi:SAM-dependent methyltransferase